MEEKKQELEILKIQKHSLIIQKQLEIKKTLIQQSLEDCNAAKKRRVLIVFDDMIADMESNEKLSPIVPELFSRGRKLNISLVFISQSYFKVRKRITLFYHENS